MYVLPYTAYDVFIIYITFLSSYAICNRTPHSPPPQNQPRYELVCACVALCLGTTYICWSVLTEGASTVYPSRFRHGVGQRSQKNACSRVAAEKCSSAPFVHETVTLSDAQGQHACEGTGQPPEPPAHRRYAGGQVCQVRQVRQARQSRPITKKIVSPAPPRWIPIISRGPPTSLFSVLHN